MVQSIGVVIRVFAGAGKLGARLACNLERLRRELFPPIGFRFFDFLHLHNARPNPGRVDCPGSQVIHEVAAQSRPSTHPVFQSHIVHCSPCIQDLLTERTRIQSRHKNRRWLVIAAAACLCLLALVSFLATGLVIAHLVTNVRARAEISRSHHEMLQRLYELAQQLLAREPDGAANKDFLEPFIGVFDVCAVCLFDAISAELHIAGDARELLEKKTGDAFVRGRDDDDLRNQIFTRCIRVAGRTTGAIGFEGLESSAVTAAGPLAALAAAHLERAHSFRKASSAAAAAQTESYRSAILDGLAHEFKTPLSTILAAAGALREVESLGPHHRMMAETVELEAARLGRLTSRLLRTARLECEEVKPWS